RPVRSDVRLELAALGEGVADVVDGVVGQPLREERVVLVEVELLQVGPHEPGELGGADVVGVEQHQEPPPSASMTMIRPATSAMPSASISKGRNASMTRPCSRSAPAAVSLSGLILMGSRRNPVRVSGSVPS